MNQAPVQISQSTRDAFERTFAELKSKNDDIRKRAAQDLRQLLENVQRGPISTRTPNQRALQYIAHQPTEASTPEQFQDAYRFVIQRASTLVVSGVDTTEKIGGIHALNELVDFKVDDAAQKTTRMANCLRTVLRGTDTAAMVVAARALGHLATPGSPFTAELVDAEVKAALESLQVDRQENRRFAAVLTLRELANNSQTLLYQYVAEILEVIWAALRDPKVLIRQSTAEAISSLIGIVAERDARSREKWFAKIYGEILKGFQLNTIDSIHGSLLALKELLLKGGMFMQSGTRYHDSCDRIFLYKDHREILIRREVITAIPILAAYYPTEFSHGFLHKFMIYLQGQLKKEKDRNPAFVAIGKVASAVGSAIDPYLDGILVYVREGLSVKARNRSTNDAPIFQCISMIAIAVGQTMTKYMDALLDPIFACGLSEALTQALVDMAHYIPPARQTIQEKLLDLISHVLCGQPFMLLGSPSHGASLVIPPRNPYDETMPAEMKEAEIALALQTLGSFDFSGYILNEFVHDVAIQYVDNDNPAIRKAAALTCCQLFVKDPIVFQVSRHAIQIVSSVVEKLLAVGVADPDPGIRHVVLTSLDPRFDRHLAKAQNIRSLFLALNDEVFSNREAAMTIIGRLSAVNPAYVFPSLRKVLVQLLTEIEYSNDSRSKQQSAQLISHLVNSSSRLIKPYVDPMVNVLMPKASDADETVASTALKAIGDLATIGGEEMSKYIPELMELILKNLHSHSSTSKRMAALTTLGQLASNAGYVIQPYTDHPELLPILINISRSEAAGSELRRETIRLIGVLGALDPNKHQQVLEQSPEHNLVSESQAVTDVSLIMEGLTPTHEEYHPTIVFTTLMNLLKDPTNFQYHQNVIEAVISIYTAMRMKCVTYLDRVIPGFLLVIRASTSPIRTEGYFNHLSELVKTVRQHIRPFLPQILDTVQTFWSEAPQAHATMLSLIENIARSLEGEFKVYLARVLPIMLGVLDEDDSPKRAPSERVLHAFLVFGSSAEEYMHLIIPVIVRMFEKRGQPASIRKLAIETIGRISRQVNISEFAAKIIHPLTRVFSGNDSSLRQTALDTLCALIFQLGPDYIPFIPTVSKILVANRVPHNNYSLIVSKLQKGEPLPQDLSPDLHYKDQDDDSKPPEVSNKLLAVNQQHLKSAWEAGNRSTQEDWREWIRRLSVELLKESPHQALRACFPLASVHEPTAKALFNSAFVSCWTQLFPQYQTELVLSIETALSSPHIPAEIVQILLNLAEFMEHDDKALPIDVRTLGQYAGKFHAFAKALHYKELEFNQEQTPTAFEALVKINNSLQQTDAAFGILARATQYQDVEMKETWYEKLQRWDTALSMYQQREINEPYSIEVVIGKMRCLHALGEWDVLSQLAEDRWTQASMEGEHRYIAPLAAAAAWGMGQWELMDKYVGALKLDSPDRSFFGAILSIHRNQFADAQFHIDKARHSLDTELSALFGESYNRAYDVIVRVQMLAELEEMITYKQSDKNPDRQETMRNTWMKRLKGCAPTVDVWQRMLKVRALVIKPQENLEMWIKFSNICRKSGRFGLAEKALRSLVDSHESLFTILSRGKSPHQVNYAILKFMWAAPASDQEKALFELTAFTARLTEDVQLKIREANTETSNQANGINGTNMTNSFDGVSSNSANPVGWASTKQVTEWQRLLAKCHLKQGQWMTALEKGDWNHDHVHEILTSYAAATRYAPNWFKAWHAWALANFEVVTSVTSAADRETAEISHSIVMDHVVPAVQGFFKSIALSSTSSLQDALRLLTLWFAHGRHAEVNAAVTEGIATVSVDTWLDVIPQLIARINQPNKRTQQSIHNLLGEVARAHPQALVYPLTVSMKSDVQTRSTKAAQLMVNLRQHSPKLVDQADLVSHELIRIAVLWHEQWHEGLEEASRLYFGDQNIDGMLAVLEPLHKLLDQGAETLREISFIQSFGRDLHEAHDWCRTYKRTHDVGDLNQAWDVYYQVFKKIARQLPQLMSLELQYVSPRLKNSVDLDLAVPGTYRSGKPVIRIASFDPVSTVISSKQRPRRLTLKGSDGVTYAYLLKGHEDIRQDERVMQLFGLVNTLLSQNPECVKRHLNIQRYSALPLSTQSGLLSWVSNSETLHVLIREYRDSRKILLNIEHRIMLQMAPDYDSLTLMQKVEVFSYAMDNTTGQDLYRVLWLKSKSSEAWLDRRTNYIRSLAVMSMVGYILGLGDRHPSNLMLDKITGKIVHIDFGDCFEVAMHRDKFPERVPFRLTRMLTYAMEVSNIEGSYRITCEAVMQVLRDNKESLMAVLEAFIHDPLLTWRLTKQGSNPEPSFLSERRASILAVPGSVAAQPGPVANPAAAGSLSGRPRTRSSVSGARPKVVPNGTSIGGPAAPPGKADANANANAAAAAAVDADFTAKEVQNARALQVLSRVKEKLTGTDFKHKGFVGEMEVKEQVDSLIHEATALENLCQHYIGWCSFW